MNISLPWTINLIAKPDIKWTKPILSGLVKATAIPSISIHLFSPVKGIMLTICLPWMMARLCLTQVPVWLISWIGKSLLRWLTLCIVRQTGTCATTSWIFPMKTSWPWLRDSLARKSMQLYFLWAWGKVLSPDGFIVKFTFSASHSSWSFQVGAEHLRSSFLRKQILLELLIIKLLHSTMLFINYWPKVNQTESEVVCIVFFTENNLISSIEDVIKIISLSLINLLTLYLNHLAFLPLIFLKLNFKKA